MLRSVINVVVCAVKPQKYYQMYPSLPCQHMTYFSAKRVTNNLLSGQLNMSLRQVNEKNYHSREKFIASNKPMNQPTYQWTALHCIWLEFYSWSKTALPEKYTDKAYRGNKSYFSMSISAIMSKTGKRVCWVLGVQLPWKDGMTCLSYGSYSGDLESHKNRQPLRYST